MCRLWRTEAVRGTAYAAGVVGICRKGIWIWESEGRRKENDFWVHSFRVRQSSWFCRNEDWSVSSQAMRPHRDSTSNGKCIVTRNRWCHFYTWYRNWEAGSANILKSSIIPVDPELNEPDAKQVKCVFDPSCRSHNARLEAHYTLCHHWDQHCRSQCYLQVCWLSDSDFKARLPLPQMLSVDMYLFQPFKVVYCFGSWFDGHSGHPLIFVQNAWFLSLPNQAAPDRACYVRQGNESANQTAELMFIYIYMWNGWLSSTSAPCRQ